MSASEESRGTVAVISVPPAHAERVKAFATSLMEEQTPDVEGYAAIVGGIGGGGGISRGPIVSALSGTDCEATILKKDFNCGDED
jgi:hypothetical protein